MATYTFKQRQSVFRASVATFFADRDNAAKLQRIAQLRDTGVYKLISHFVGAAFGELVQLRTGATVRLNETYRNTMANYKKRYFNILSEEGKGELVWAGSTNPVVHTDAGVSEPLPRLLVLKWLIHMGFDDRFWDRFDAIKAHHDATVAETKRRYTENHRRKNAIERRPIEEEIIRERKPSTAKKSVKFTRVERRAIAARLKARRAEDKKRLKKDRLAGRLTKTPRTSVQGCAIILKIK